jgi:hypothetical protein
MIQTIQLHVKGTQADLLVASRAHGIDVTDVRTHPKFDETISRCRVDSNSDVIVRWYCEAPYVGPNPAGTLLFFSVVKEEK